MAAIGDPMEAVLLEVRRRLSSGREGNFVAELGGESVGFALYWGRIRDEALTSPADERYLVDEVRPAGLDAADQIEWEPVPGGRERVTAWNIGEAIERTHELAAGAVVLVREELDSGSPVEFRALFYSVPQGGGGGSRMCRVESYDAVAQSYTVRPVVWNGSAWVASGEAVVGVRNVGELHPVEHGYLAGPAAHVVYARLYDESGGKVFMAVHPPRLL